ncbi:MAG: hypothetical protein IH996_08945 [Proteobacteria bacterium]|nr:hypothetical protein [Pseudomonadota bacterium]
MTETKIRETNITGDGDDAIVRVVIADSDTFDDARLYLALSVQSNVDGPFLAHIQRNTLQIAQKAIAAALDDCVNKIRKHDGDL